MIAGLDVATGMMDGPGGAWLTSEAITEAIGSAKPGPDRQTHHRRR